MKKKSSSSKQKKDYYRSTIYALEEREKKERAKEELVKKGIVVGEGYNVKKLKQEYAKEKVKETLEKVGSRLEKKKLFTKPHARVKTISNKALARNLASGNYTMFKSEGRDYSSVPEQDNRSLFFQSELNKVKTKALSGGWL
jgi:hypothetical protein